jgi:hypothetical protein
LYGVRVTVCPVGGISSSPRLRAFAGGEGLHGLRRDEVGAGGEILRVLHDGAERLHRELSIRDEGEFALRVRRTGEAARDDLQPGSSGAEQPADGVPQQAPGHHLPGGAERERG